MFSLKKSLTIILGAALLSACGGGGGGQAFTITANAQCFSTDEDAVYIGTLSASTSSSVTLAEYTAPAFNFKTL